MRLSPYCPRAVAIALGLLLSSFSSGCGPAETAFDKAAQYTPDSLAEELAYRYRGLKPESKKSTRRAVSTAKSAKRAADLDRARLAEKKGGDTPTTKKKQTGPPTIDDVLDDISSKLDQITGASRAESCRRMAESLSKDNSLSDADKQLLSEKLKELGGES
jgi:hypothetical protein